MACTDITFSEGDNQGFNNKITTVSGALTDIVIDSENVSGQLIMVTNGEFNAAMDIVSNFGSITIVIPAGTVNPVTDIIVDGDFDEIPETELVGVPNVILSAPRKVR